MYIIGWNQEKKRLEANLGGHITIIEAKVFAEDLLEHVACLQEPKINLLLDYSTASNIDTEVFDVLEQTHEELKTLGADHLVIVARDDDQIITLTNRRLQEVLEGREEYVTYDKVA